MLSIISSEERKNGCWRCAERCSVRVKIGLAFNQNDGKHSKWFESIVWFICILEVNRWLDETHSDFRNTFDAKTLLRVLPSTHQKPRRKGREKALLVMYIREFHSRRGTTTTMSFISFSCHVEFRYSERPRPRWLKFGIFSDAGTGHVIARDFTKVK